MTDGAAAAKPGSPQTDPTKTKLSLSFQHSRPLTACHWDPTSRFIFFGAEDHLVHRFEVATKKAKSLAAHDSWVRSFGSSPDGKVLYSGGYDGRLIFWPATAADPKPLRTIDAHNGWVRAIAVSPDGKTVATCGNDQLVKLWNAADGKPLRTFAGHQSHVYNLTFARKGAALVSCDLKGVVNLWELERAGKPRQLATVKALHGYDTTFRADIGGARSIAMHSGGGQVALGGITNVTNAFAGVGEIALALVDVNQGQVNRVLRSKAKTRGAVWGVAHHPDNYWIGLSGGGGGFLWFWKGDAEHEFHQLKLKSDGRGMSISPDRRRLAVAHADKQLRTYQLHA